MKVKEILHFLLTSQKRDSGKDILRLAICTPESFTGKEREETQPIWLVYYLYCHIQVHNVCAMLLLLSPLLMATSSLFPKTRVLIGSSFFMSNVLLLQNVWLPCSLCICGKREEWLCCFRIIGWNLIKYMLCKPYRKNECFSPHHAPQWLSSMYQASLLMLQLFPDVLSMLQVHDSYIMCRALLYLLGIPSCNLCWNQPPGNWEHQAACISCQPEILVTT